MHIKYCAGSGKIYFKTVNLNFQNWVLILISDYSTQASLQPSKSGYSIFSDILWSYWYQQYVSFDQRSILSPKSFLKQLLEGHPGRKYEMQIFLKYKGKTGWQDK